MVESNVAEINSNEIFFKQTRAGISCFCQRTVSPQEGPEKRRCFWTFMTTNSLTEEVSVKQYDLWRLVKASYKVIEKFDKVCA